jgi:carboxyl-terminal processing protease
MNTRKHHILLGCVLALSLLSAGLHSPSTGIAADGPSTTDEALSATCPAAEQQSAVVQRAFGLLMDRFEAPLSSASLLQAGWDELATEAEQHAAPLPQMPPFTDDPDQDTATTRASLLEYAITLHCDAPDGWNPAHALVRGMAVSVHERHTYFLDPPHYRDYLDWSNGSVHYAGIGARFKGPGLVVLDVFDNTPAARAGLIPGDEILEVNGESVSGRPPSEGVQRVRGLVGTPVDLLVKPRGDQEARHVVRLLREDVQLDFVVPRLLDGHIGYVLLRGFPEPSVVDSVEQALSEFADEGVRGLVLDLRGNAGGRLDVGARLLSDFVPSGTSLFEQIDRDGVHATRSASGGAAAWSLPLEVLVDEQTASMGEIFAAAVQEYGLGTVLGTTTAGSVAGGQLFPLGDGSALNVTAFEIRSASGAALNGVGVSPDETILGDRVTSPTGSDPSLDRALAMLE